MAKLFLDALTISLAGLVIARQCIKWHILPSLHQANIFDVGIVQSPFPLSGLRGIKHLLHINLLSTDTIKTTPSPAVERSNDSRGVLSIFTELSFNKSSYEACASIELTLLHEIAQIHQIEMVNFDAHPKRGEIWYLANAGATTTAMMVVVFGLRWQPEAVVDPLLHLVGSGTSWLHPPPPTTRQLRSWLLSLHG
jgi:hypothetical protein